MTVKVVMPVRTLNLVEPLAHKATAMRTTETAGAAGVIHCPASPDRGRGS